MSVVGAVVVEAEVVVGGGAVVVGVVVVGAVAVEAEVVVGGSGLTLSTSVLQAETERVRVIASINPRIRRVSQTRFRKGVGRVDGERRDCAPPDSVSAPFRE